MYKMAVIGTGIVAHANVNAAKKFSSLDLCAVANRTLQKGLDFAAEYGIDSRHVYSDYVQMLDKEKPEVLMINLPHYLHHEAFVECAKRGMAVLMEKPLGVNVNACRVINEWQKKSGVKLMICHTQRYYPSFITAKAVIDEGKLGRLTNIQDIIYYNYFFEGRPEWFLDPEKAGGGILVNYGVHTFDRIQHLSGKWVRRLYAHIDWEQPGITVDSGYQVMGEMDDGVAFSMTCTGYTGPWTSATMFVFTGGILRVNMKGNNAETEGVLIGTNEHDYESVPLIGADQSAVYWQMKDFVDYLEGRQECPIDGQYGEWMLTLVDASYRSHEAHAVVEVKG